MAHMHHLNHLTAIGGGIGSGKSVVCNVLRKLGYTVYDCDSRARTIMDNDEKIIQTIAQSISPQAIQTLPDGSKKILRPLLAETVFSNHDKLKLLNATVHKAVIADIEKWHANLTSGNLYTNQPLFVESAIIIESGIDKIVQEIWEVTAPVELRIARVANRDNLSHTQILKRINAQNASLASAHCPIYTIINDGLQPLLPQILHLLQNLQ